MFRKTAGIILVAASILTACRDSGAPIDPLGAVQPNESEGRGIGDRLYSIGTSVSAGTCSDGNVAACQHMSWVAQLVRSMHREPSLPLISGTGCKSPFAAPLISFKRTSGESVAIADAVVLCAPNEPQVELPAHNLALPGALTQDALATTPEAKTDPFGSQLYRRLLPPGETQVSAMEKQNPKLVTIELGINDILGVHSGVVIPGVSFVPYAVWAGQYDQVLDRAAAVTKQALLVGLGHDIANLSSLRRGGELWADRVAFLTSFNVEVSDDCLDSPNLIVVPVRVPAAVANGLGRKAAGLSPFVLSCAAGPSTTQDRVLTPAEVAVVNAQFEQMNEHIRMQAAERGYAFFELEVLYRVPKGAFSVVTLMTSAEPYGPNISLDGLHPSAAGHTILANAAAQAIDARYHIGISAIASGISTSPSNR